MWSLLSGCLKQKGLHFEATQKRDRDFQKPYDPLADQFAKSVSFWECVGRHEESKWVVVKIMVPFWVPIIVRHLIFRVPKKEP